VKVKRHFGETCRLHLQGWRISQARNQHEAGAIATSVDFLRNIRRYIPVDILFIPSKTDGLNASCCFRTCITTVWPFVTCVFRFASGASFPSRRRTSLCIHTQCCIFSLCSKSYLGFGFFFFCKIAASWAWSEYCAPYFPTSQPHMAVWAVG
jgi:hypothetical protein